MPEEAIQEEVNEEVEVNEDEARAREMGWRPVEEFDGDPENHMDVDTFLRKRDVKALREEKEEFLKEIKASKAAAEAAAKMARETAKLMQEKEEAAYQRGLAEIRSQMKEAVSEGDVDTYDKLEKQLDTIKKPEPVTPPSMAFEEFVSENPWFNKYPRLREAAINIPFPEGTPESEQFREIGRIIREDYYDHPAFINEEREKPAAIEKGSPPTKKPKGKGFDDLDEMAQSVCKELESKHKRTGGKDGMTRDEYIKSYFGDM